VNSLDFMLFCLQLILMLSFALAFGQLAKKIRQPAVFGELLGGIILGPTVFGAIAPGFHATIFPAAGQVAFVRETLIKLGMLFFLFTAGLEVNPAGLKKSGRPALFTSLFGIVVPFVFGMAMVKALDWLWLPRIGIGINLFAFFMGTALSISALPIIARILMDLKLTRDPIGDVIMTAAVINDLFGWTIFALIIGAIRPAGGLEIQKLPLMLAELAVFVWLVFALGRGLGRNPLARFMNQSGPSGSRLMLLTILMLTAALSTEMIGIHAIFGAFLLGVALDFDRGENNHAHEIIGRFAIGFFAPLYFVSIGLRANFIADFNLPLFLLILLTASAGKILGSGAGARAGGMLPREALAVGFGMNARGVMEILLASVALEYAIINRQVYVALVAMALISSMASGPLMKMVLKPSGR